LWGGSEVAKQLEERALSANPPYHLATHHAAFSASAFCEAAIDFAELPILARQGVAGFAPKPNF